jgi:pimeloyl-ACP methyl ester carboxylesterase
MGYEERVIATPDGRNLEVASLGDPSGPTVVFHHGTPGATSSMRALARLATAGYFVVTLSRPGYGGSSRLEGRAVASVVDDVGATLAAYGRGEYVSVGWSGGGPHAISCAALDPSCRGAVSLAGVAPSDVDFDWTAGMGPENLEEFALAKEGGPRYLEMIQGVGDVFSAATPENVVEAFGGLLSPADQSALVGLAARTDLADGVRQAFAQGWHGYHDDDRAFFSPWGFDLAKVPVPVEVWYGDDDLMVPPTHGAWLARHIPTATEVHRPAEGHLSLVATFLDELAASNGPILG